MSAPRRIKFYEGVSFRVDDGINVGVGDVDDSWSWVFWFVFGISVCECDEDECCDNEKCKFHFWRQVANSDWMAFVFLSGKIWRELSQSN